MTNKNAELFKELEIAKMFKLLAEKLQNIAKLLWDVDGDKCYEFETGATLTIWQDGVYEFDADGITLALRT